MTPMTTEYPLRRGNDRAETGDAKREASPTRLRPYLRFASAGVNRIRVPPLRFVPFRVT